MSDKDPKAPAPKKSSGGVVGLVLPAALAAGASFGGARFAGARAAHAATHAGEHGAATTAPGPTLALDPFLVTTTDAQHRPHALRVALAVEYDASVRDGAWRSYIPRIRDAALTYLRSVPFEEAIDSTRGDHMRADLLERFHTTGPIGATRVLITDIVAQ